VQIVKDMDTTKIIAVSNQYASNAQVTTWQTNTTEKKDLVMSDVSSVMEIILRIVRNVRSSRTYEGKHIHLSVWNNTFLPHKSDIPYKLNQA
jgi:hypothetical protein